MRFFSTVITAVFCCCHNVLAAVDTPPPFPVSAAFDPPLTYVDLKGVTWPVFAAAASCAGLRNRNGTRDVYLLYNSDDQESIS